MFERVVPPVDSPVDASALAAGLRGVLRGRDAAERRVRDRISSRFGARDVILTDSGTSALSIALGGLHTARGRPLALPAYGCYDLATAADAADVPVCLYDLEPRSLAPDPDSFRAVLGEEPAAVVLVHLYGIPLPMEQLVREARDAGAVVVEDAAQGFGGEANGRPMGSWGDVSVLSFGRGKGVTGGGGGALIVRSSLATDPIGPIAADLPKGGLGIRSLLVAMAQWAFGSPRPYGLALRLPGLHLGETRYLEAREPARTPSACLGLVSRTWELGLEAVPDRRRAAESLRRLTDAIPGLTAVGSPESGEGSWLRFPVLVADPAIENRLQSSGARRLGVMPGYPRPLDRLRPFRDRIVNGCARHAGAEDLAGGLFTLPTHARRRNADVRRLHRFLTEAAAAGG